VNDHCGWATVQPSDGLSVPTNQPLTNQNPTKSPRSDIVTCAPANMPEAPQPFEPTGLCPDQLHGDVDLQPQINPLASSDVGGTAGHDAAVCVSARGKSDGASVCDARDANIMLSPTTLSPQARQVVAPQIVINVNKCYIIIFLSISSSNTHSRKVVNCGVSVTSMMMHTNTRFFFSVRKYY